LLKFDRTCGKLKECAKNVYQSRALKVCTEDGLRRRC